MAALDLAFCLYRWTPFGGLERNCLELALAARARGHRVSVYTRSWAGERPAGVGVRELSVRALTNIGLDRAFARALAPELARAQHDVVVGFNLLPGLDVFYAADPCLLASRGRPSRLAPANRRQRAAWERALCAPAASTRLLVLTEREERRYREHHGTPAARLHLLPPGLRAEFLAPGPARAPALRAELGIPEEALLVLAVGSDFARKGLDRTIDALAELPSQLRGRTWLLAVGAGRRARFGRRARALGFPRVRFVGGRRDVLDCYRAADLLLHPARVENTGSVLLEALSQGVPVVAAQACGFAAHVRAARAGIVLGEPFAAAELARALRELLGDGAHRRDLGENGRRAARDWPMGTRTAAALAVIEDVAREKRAAGALPACGAR